MLICILPQSDYSSVVKSSYIILSRYFAMYCTLHLEPIVQHNKMQYRKVQAFNINSFPGTVCQT